jgi:short-subunit dehydrogenase
MPPTPRKSVFITGASSGIGLRLAHEYAARGWDLCLAARRLETLESLKAEIAADYPHCVVCTYALDVTRYDDVFTTLQAAVEQLGRVDLVIANAGIGSRGYVGHGHFDDHRAIIETNVIGAMATCDAAIKLFKKQGTGHLVVISSVAAFRGLPGGSAYSASKAAIATYADAIRAETYASGIKVTTIYPGFIDTPINQSNPSRPFLITVERGAKLIADRIDRGVQSAVVPTFPWLLLKWLAKIIPTSLLATRRR